MVLSLGCLLVFSWSVVTGSWIGVGFVLVVRTAEYAMHQLREFCNDIVKVHWCHGYLKVSSWHNTSVLIMQRAWTHTPTEKFLRSMFRKEGEPAGKTGRVWFAKSHHSSAKVYVPAKCQTSGHKSELSPFTAAS